MFINENKSLPAFVDSNDSFIVCELPWLTEKLSSDCLYQQIVYKVLRKPKKLTFHLQRIYFTYHYGMTDQLYAGLVDLVSVLDGKGSALSYRMIKATQSLLTEVQVKALDNYLKTQNYRLLVSNQYSVCTTDIINTQPLLIINKEEVADEYDPLSLARDYIEYSQLDSALKTLEVAILETPERQDIQLELLELLKQTKNVHALTRIRKKLTEKQWDETVEWQKLADHFAGKGNEK